MLREIAGIWRKKVASVLMFPYLFIRDLNFTHIILPEAMLLSVEVLLLIFNFYGWESVAILPH